MSDALKQQAAKAVLDLVEPGMRLGIGSGSTADHFTRQLGDRVREGLDIVGVPTSERTADLARSVGIRLTTLDDTPSLDLTIDGAGELDGALRLIKGGGGALLREKIVAAASAKMAVIADGSKLVETLGAYALPIEIVPFGAGATLLAIQKTLAEVGDRPLLTIREAADGANYLTDGGHWIVDAAFGRISDPEAVSERLNRIPGVVEHGLFIGLARTAYIAGHDGVRVYSL